MGLNVIVLGEFGAWEVIRSKKRKKKHKEFHLFKILEEEAALAIGDQEGMVGEIEM